MSYPRTPEIRRYWPYVSEAELAGVASLSLRDLAAARPDLAAEAERLALRALERHAPGFSRSRAFDQVLLARTRFLMAEPDQASADGIAAIEMAGRVTASARVVTRLRSPMADSEPYRDRPAVRDFRERLRLAVAN